MFRQRRGIVLSELPKYLAKGYGRGEGASYQPMIHVQDFPSRGWRYREVGIKTGRQHDYLSSPELKYHYILDRSDVVLDIREQFPLLPVQLTLEIAEMCSVSHPMDKSTKEPFVMTTDFLIKLRQPVGSIELARTVKLAKDLENKRTIEKFEIERRFWQAKGIDWGIVTENEINDDLAENAKWVHKYAELSSVAPLTHELVRLIGAELTMMVSTGKGSLNKLAAESDRKFGLGSGQSLAIARHLIASRQWVVDMSKPVHPSERLILISHTFVVLKK
jgi:hypothetical protein